MDILVEFTSIEDLLGRNTSLKDYPSSPFFGGYLQLKGLFCEEYSVFRIERTQDKKIVLNSGYSKSRGGEEILAEIVCKGLKEEIANFEIKTYLGFTGRVEDHSLVIENGTFSIPISFSYVGTVPTKSNQCFVCIIGHQSLCFQNALWAHHKQTGFVQYRIGRFKAPYNDIWIPGNMVSRNCHLSIMFSTDWNEVFLEPKSEIAKKLDLVSFCFRSGWEFTQDKKVRLETPFLFAPLDDASGARVGALLQFSPRK
jgi:hypothetical protein